MLMYTRASLELCLDLTDPRAQSVPIGALVLGESGDMKYAALATVAEPRGPLDPMTLDLVYNIPHILRVKVASAVKHTNFETNAILQHLNLSMRGSIYVGTIESAASEPVDEAATAHDVAMRLIRIASDHLNQLSRPVAPERMEWWPVVQPEAQHVAC